MSLCRCVSGCDVSKGCSLSSTVKQTLEPKFYNVLRNSGTPNLATGRHSTAASSPQQQCYDNLKCRDILRGYRTVDCVWNVMAHAQKPDFVFRRNGRVHLNRRGNQFSRLLAGELYTSACMVCTARASLCSAVMRRLLVTHSIRHFPLHFSSRASPCAITFQKQSAHRALQTFLAFLKDTANDCTGEDERRCGCCSEPWLVYLWHLHSSVVHVTLSDKFLYKQ